MAKKVPIETTHAPAAIGTYSQAIKAGNTVYLSGQIPLVPETMKVIDGDIEQMIQQVFDNLSAVAEAAGGTLSDIVKLTVYLTDLDNFALVNEIMANNFEVPFPARAAVGVKALPKQVPIEMDAIMLINA